MSLGDYIDRQTHPQPSPEAMAAAGIDSDRDLEAQPVLTGVRPRIIVAQRELQELIMPGGTAQTIRTKIVPIGKLTPEMVSALMFSVVGIGAMQAEALGLGHMNKKQLAKHCSVIISYFGTNGTSLAAIIEP
jgi:hypothetical protein